VFLAFIYGMAARADIRFSGDWYRDQLGDDRPITVPGPDGESLSLSRTKEGSLSGELATPDREPLLPTAAPAAPADGLFHRDDADEVLGAVALSGTNVCAVKRTDDGRILPGGRWHIEVTLV
jgi:hypothetical protein